MWFHFSKLCPWDVGAELSSEHPLGPADCFWEVSLEKVQVLSQPSPFPASPRWTQKRYQAQSPLEYMAPLCRCGKGNPSGWWIRQRYATWVESPADSQLGHQSLVGSCLTAPGAGHCFCYFLSYQRVTISRFRENNSRKNFPFLLFLISEETWRIQVYKRNPVKYPTPLTKWILFELWEKPLHINLGFRWFLAWNFRLAITGILFILVHLTPIMPLCFIMKTSAQELSL